MSVEDCGNVELPPWSYSVPSLNSEQEDPSDPASKIASLLLAKLADYVVPGEQLWDGKIGTAIVDTHTSFHLSTVAAVLCDKRDEEGRRGMGREGGREIPKPVFSLHKQLCNFSVCLKDVRQFFLQPLLNLTPH